MADRYPVYRLTLFKPINQDATETTPLVPAGTAPHSDPFRVSTAPVFGDSSGAWKPYLAMPRGGRHARIDPIDCTTDIGSWTAEIADVALEDDDVVRWLSAFMGDAKARDQLLGIRAQREVSYDGGLTWDNDFGGRVQDVKGDSRIGWSIPIRDEPDRLDVDVFVGRPPATVTDAWQQPVLPLGRLFGVPTTPAIGADESTWATTGHYQAMTFHNGGNLVWNLDDLTEDEKYHWCVPKALAELATSDVWVVTGRLLQFTTNRVYLELQDSGGTVQGRMWVRWMTTAGFHDHWRVTSIAVEPLSVTDAHYLEPPATDTVLYGALYPSGAPTEASPLVIGKDGRVNLITLLGDLLDGVYGRRDTAGNPIDVVRRNTASFTALAASIDALGYAVITEKQKLKDFVTDKILKPLSLVLVPDATGALDVVSLQRPDEAVTGLLSITDADLVGTADAERWSVEGKDRTNLVQLHLFDQGHVTAKELAESQDDSRYLDPPLLLLGFPEQPPYLISALGDDRAAVAKPQLQELDLSLFLLEDGVKWGTRAATDLIARFGLGPRYVTLRLRRGTQHDDIRIGDRRTLATSGVPDPTSHQLGIDRVAICLDVTPNVNDIEAVFLDEGINTGADVPTLGDLTLADGTIPDTVVDPYHIAILDSPAADAAGNPIEIQVALTEAGDASPAADSSKWARYRDLLRDADGTALVFLMLFPQGKRLWVRGRSLPDTGDATPLPGAWVFPTPSSIVMGVRTAWSGLAVSGITAHTAHLTWTPGSIDLLQRVYLDGVLVDTVPAGSIEYDLSGLTENTNYDVSVVGVDAQGGETAATTANFTTLNVNTGIPAPNGLQVVVPSAITLRLFWSDTAFPGTIERAPDDGTGLAPDTGSAETIADGIAGGTGTYTDPQPIGPTIWWYRFAEGSGGVVGPWAAWVKAIAQSGTVEPSQPPVDTGLSFTTAAPETSLPGSRQWADGDGTEVDLSVAGEIKTNISSPIAAAFFAGTPEEDAVLSIIGGIPTWRPASGVVLVGFGTQFGAGFGVD